MIVCATSRNADMQRLVRDMANFLGCQAHENGKSLGGIWAILRATGGWLSAPRQRLVILPTTSIWNVPIVLLLRLLGRRVFVGIHDVEGHDPPDKKKVHLYNNALSLLASEIIVFSAFSRDRFATVFSRRKPCRVYYFGTDLIFRPSSKTLDVLMFGRLKPYTGIDNLLEIVQRCPKLQFCVAGRNAPAKLQDRAPNLRVISSFLSDAQLFALIGAARVVLLPYRSATQSGAIPLALSHGTWIVGYNVGGLREQTFGLVGNFATPGNLSELVEILAERVTTPFNEETFSL